MSKSLEKYIDTFTSNTEMPSVTLEAIVVKAKRCGYGCDGTGIPVLPVVFSQYDYKLNDNDKRYFKDRLSSYSTEHNAIASLSIQTYLYYISKKNSSDGKPIWAVEEIFTGKDGALKRVITYSEEDFLVKNEEKINEIELESRDEPDNENIDEIVQPALCDRKSHSTLDSKYITLESDEVAWLMISHAKLSKETLKKYFYDKTLRNRRMQKFVVADLVNNKNTKSIYRLSPELDYINSFHQRKHLARGGDIDDQVTIQERDLKNKSQGALRAANLLYNSMERSINKKIEDIEESSVYEVKGSSVIIDLSDADELSNNLKKSKWYKEVKPMMVALPDPVGEVIAAAEKRNYLIDQLSELSEDRDYIRKTINALIIKKY